LLLLPGSFRQADVDDDGLTKCFHGLDVGLFAQVVPQVPGLDAAVQCLRALVVEVDLAIFAEVGVPQVVGGDLCAVEPGGVVPLFSLDRSMRDRPRSCSLAQVPRSSGR
jgi:hypothetical protein